MGFKSPPKQRYDTFKSLYLNLKHLCSATLKQIQNLVPHRLMSRLKIQVHSRRHSCDVTSSSIWRPSLPPEKLAQDPIARFSSASLQTAFQTRSRAHYEVFLILVLHHPETRAFLPAPRCRRNPPAILCNPPNGGNCRAGRAHKHHPCRGSRPSGQ